MENTEIFRGCQPVTLWQLTSTGVRVSGAPTHPGRWLSGTKTPLRMNCRAVRLRDILLRHRPLTTLGGWGSG